MAGIKLFLVFLLFAKSNSSLVRRLIKRESFFTSSRRLHLSGSVGSTPLSAMSDFTPDLDAYFKRINYGGPVENNLETLKQIQKHHLKTLPFENLNIHLKRPIILDVKTIEDKLIRSKRGGYCFELNILLLHVLRAIGFEVCPLVARVILNKRADQVSGLTHVVLRVEAEGSSWLVDTGFGHFGPLEPLKICLDG
jgi:N-hydroxyarylamine O-acetyltransferase